MNWNDDSTNQMRIEMQITIEPSNDVKIHVCKCCGKEYKSTHGFVYADGNAFAVYFAALYFGNVRLG